MRETDHDLRRTAWLALILGLLALLAVAVTHLALTDIQHGETDLAAEWGAVRWGLFLVAAALIAGIRLAAGLVQRR